MKVLPAIAVLLSLVLAAFMPTGTQARTCLLILDHETGEVLHEIPLAEEKAFTIRYIHSVDHFPVFEVFRASEVRGVVLEETYFEMFGAGMGHWEGHGTLVQDGKWIKIKDMDQTLGRFLLRVGSPGVDHTILVDGKAWNLSRTVPGRCVEVMVRDR